MTKHLNDHYSLAFQIETLEAWSAAACKEVRKALPKGSAPIFIYSGFSGIVHGQALARAWFKIRGPVFGQIYVRKPREKSHGEAIHVSIENIPVLEKNMKPCTLVFVDDFTSSGNTRCRTIQKARLVWKDIWEGWALPLSSETLSVTVLSGERTKPRLRWMKNPREEEPFLKPRTLKVKNK